MPPDFGPTLVGRTRVTSFDALLFDGAERVVAGGDLFHRRPQGAGFFIERRPFLAVSGADEGVDLPSCSEPTEISVNMPVPGQMFGTLWMDRTATEFVEWSGGTTLNDFVRETLRAPESCGDVGSTIGAAPS